MAGPISPDVAHHRAVIAATKRHNPNADLTEQQRQLKAAKLADHIRRTLDAAPPLSPCQRDALALLLRTPSGGAAAARSGAPPGRPAALASGGTTSAETGTQARHGDAA